VIEFFERARPGFRHALDVIEHYRADLLTIGNEPAPAPRWTQDWFPRLDGAAAYSFVRAFKPSRIIEVGSGHSTRFLVRAIRDETLKTAVTTIDPSPKRSPEGLPVDYLATPVQEIPATQFDSLRSGDILFIDSSHRYMPGSDVAFLQDEILPRLAAGVIVHIHDIFLPDAYPAEWAWRGYSEQQALRRLIEAGQFECLFSSHYVTRWMPDSLVGHVVRRLPLPAGAYESSLWLRIVPASSPAPHPD
jgi:hypothetical protein